MESHGNDPRVNGNKPGEPTGTSYQIPMGFPEFSLSRGTMPV